MYFLLRIKKNTLLQYKPYVKYLNVDIVSCFDNMAHSSIFRITPIADKYLFLVKTWLKAPIVGPEAIDSKKITRSIPKAGVPQGSIIGPIVCNIVLDGLNRLFIKFVLKTLVTT